MHKHCNSVYYFTSSQLWSFINIHRYYQETTLCLWRSTHVSHRGWTGSGWRLRGRMLVSLVWEPNRWRPRRGTPLVGHFALHTHADHLQIRTWGHLCCFQPTHKGQNGNTCISMCFFLFLLIYSSFFGFLVFLLFHHVFYGYLFLIFNSLRISTEVWYVWFYMFLYAYLTPFVSFRLLSII